MALRDLIPRRHAARPLAVRREEGSPFATLRDEMDHLFDDFFRSAEGWWPMERFTPATEGYLPQVDVSEDDEQVVVTAELPGMEEKDIDISVAGDLLTLKGEKHAERETKEKDYVRTERSFGSFRRTIQLPCEAKDEGATATFKHGVLTVTLPKSERARKERHHIEVKAA